MELGKRDGYAEGRSSGREGVIEGKEHLVKGRNTQSEGVLYGNERAGSGKGYCRAALSGFFPHASKQKRSSQAEHTLPTDSSSRLIQEF